MPSRHLQAGSTLLWLTIWLVGMAAIAYWCVMQHVPALQQQIVSNAEAAVSSANAGDIDVNVVGRTATLSGMVTNDVQRNQLINVVRDADGVRTVNDQLSLLKTADANEGVVVSDAFNAATTDESKTTSQNTDKSSSTENDEPASTNSILPTNNDDKIVTNDVDAEADINKTSEVTTDAKNDVAANEALATATVNEADEKASVFDAATAAINPDTAQATETAAQVANLAVNPYQVKTPESKETASQLSERARVFIEQARKETAGSLIDPQTPNTDAAVNSTALDTPSEDTTGSLIDPQTPRTDTGVVPKKPTVNLSDAQRSVAITEFPSFKMQVDGGTLTLTGDLSDQDSLLEFIRSAMSTFNANYVVNSVQVSDSTTQADWLPALNQFLPMMGNITNAGIDIVESQITLTGIAANNDEHDTIINLALTELSELSLVERISIDTALAEKISSPAKPDNTDTNTSSEKTSDVIDTTTQVQSLETAFDALAVEKILFESGSDILTDESLAVVETIASLFAKYPSIGIEIDGHTDASGISANNLKLSQLRANAVRDYLVQQGIALERLNAYGFGDGVPIADNSTPAGRRLNRRIEFNF